MTDYQKAWREYKRLRNLALVLLLFATIILVCFRFRGSVLDSIAGHLLYLTLFVLLLVFSLFFTGIKLASWRCPRCGKRYFIRTRQEAVFGNLDYLIIFRKKCVHCGLAKYQAD